MASKRVRKPPSRYLDDVESPFVNRPSRTPAKLQNVPMPSTEAKIEPIPVAKIQNGRAVKAQLEKTPVNKQQNGRADSAKPKNGRPASKKSNNRAKKNAASKIKRPKMTYVESDEDREHPDFYSNSSESESDESSLQSDDKDFELLENGVDDYFYEEDDEFETYSEASRGPTMSVASSSAYEDIPVCPWVEISADRLPRLDLPSGSKDLLIDDSLLFDALEIYETCRNYYRTIRLSPFLFEDFCAALMSDEQSLLLAEIHIALLKLVLKNDEEDQVTLSVQDTNNSFNIIVHLVEPMTYAEVLRQYVESDPRRFPSEVLEALDGNYPFVGVRRRMIVLLWLCDRFLNSNDYRNIIRNEGKFISDEHCRECGKQGDMLLCDGCEACYHLACANLTTVPEGQWLCQVCVLHQVQGVTDCGQLSNRSHRMPFRVSPLGYDRHGRRYWFAVRRIIVQDDVNGSVHYYSTLPQLHALLSRFAVGDLEKNLAVAIMNALPKIEEEMHKTLELTNDAAKQSGKRKETYLVSDNLERMADIFTQPLACTSCESDDERTVAFFEGKPVEISKTMLLTKVEELLGFKDGLFSDLFWTSGLSAEKVLARRNNRDLDRAVASLSEQPVEEILEPLGFRLGENRSFRKYQNQYSINDYAKTPHMRAKERDRKKYLCNRFSLAEEGAFEWCLPKGDYLYGSEASTARIIQFTIYKLSQRIPTALMHRYWRRDGLDGFTKNATAPASSVCSLRDLLLRFECGIRKPVMASVFWGTLGHTRLIRLTAEDRETKQMVDAKRKKMDRELIVADADDEESDVVWVKYAKLGGPPKHNIWRLKDEQYRVNGRGGLSGWLWVSRTMRRDIRHLPAKPPLGITADTPPNELKSVEVKKAHRLAKLVDKLSSWRKKENAVEAEKTQKSELLKCYSPTCRNGLLPLPICSGTDVQQQCYSVLCRQAYKNCLGMLTSGAVKAHNPFKSTNAKGTKDGSKKIIGEDVPFPLPVPFDYRVRRTAEQSLLVLPQVFLKRLARQGGLRADVFAPGFHRIAKSNMQVWNYPCQRPLFDHCWRYLTLRARSYHAIALQLRILYACVRWADMERDEDEDELVTIHHPDHDEVRTVVGHKEFPPDGLYERYKLKVQLIPLEDPNDMVEETGEDEEGYRPGRAIDVTRSSRKRKVVSKVRDAGHNGIRNTSKMKTVEKWIDGVELKLWEIIAYWNSREVRKPSAQARDQLKSATARASAMGAGNNSSLAASRGMSSRRRTQPKRLPEYDYELSDEEYSRSRKHPRYDKERRPRYSRERSIEHDSRELVYSEQRKPARYVSERPSYYSSQRPSLSASARSFSSRESDKSGIHTSDSPFNPRFRMRCHVVENERNCIMPVSGREIGCLRGGGKVETSEHSEEQSTSGLPLATTSEDVDRPGSGSPIDEPPLIPRYDNTNYDEVTQERLGGRGVAMQHRRVVYASPSSSSTSVRPLASKVLMIRRADGTTQFLRPIAQSSSKDDRGQTRTVITTAQVGGSTMSEARKNMGLSGLPQRVVPGGNVFSPRQIGNRSLVDHSGLIQQRRIVPALRGRPNYAQPQTRIVRITPSAGQQPSTSSNVYSTTPLRVPSSTLGNGMLMAEKDPFMKRMAAEKAISGTPTMYSNSSSSTVRRRPSGRDTYAGYYGEKSNDRIDVEEYQMLAEQGYRPPGRPPGRLASTFGYGPRVNQQRAILLARGGRDGMSPSYNGDGAAVVSPGSGRYDAGASRIVQSPSRGITTVGTFSGGQYRVRNVTTYKEYCLRKGIDWNGERFRRQLARPVRFEFESNEEEERAIAEAIAKEEELMRLEEERKRMAMGISVETDLTRFEEELRRKELTVRRETEMLRISSLPNRRMEENLTVREGDSSDAIQIKQVLNELVVQVCKWDKDYNWHKNLLRKAREKNDVDRYFRTCSLRTYKTSRSRQKQLEIDLSERMDRFRKEVNKRRVRLEGKVEEEMGMIVPWRRPRGRPNKAIRQQYLTASSQPSACAGSGENQSAVDGTGKIKKEVEAQPELSTVLDPAGISLSETPCRNAPSGEFVQEDRKSDVLFRVQSPRVSDDVLSESEKLKEKGKEKKKIGNLSDDAKKLSSPGASTGSGLRGRGRPRKEAEESPRPSTSSSFNSPKLEAQIKQNAAMNKLCICNKPFNPKAFHVGCSSCYRWFHGKCVSISEKKWPKLKNWTCQNCSNPNVKEEVLYCLCRTPYDDSRFYVGCDHCEGWYHPQCVGITQAEAEAMEEYVCPTCIKSQQPSPEPIPSTSTSFGIVLTRKDYDLIGQLLTSMKEQRASWPFRDRLDEKAYPDYYHKIKKPMDLTVVEDKIEHLKYHKLEEFLEDIKLIFENARAYHPKSAAIYRCADTLERKFDTSFARVKKQIELRNRERLRVSESRTVDSLDINTDELFPMGSDFDASLFDDLI